MLRILTVVLVATTTAGCTTAWYTAWKRQQERKEALRPKRSTSPSATVGPRNRIRVRLWADDDYRAQTGNWKRQINRVVARASDLAADAGADFDVIGIEAWSRVSGTSLAEDLRALRAVDKGGDDVDVVVGLVSAAPAFTSALGQLGYAEVLGRYFVVRGMDDTHEYDGLMRGMSMVSQSEMSAIYLERRRHKEAVSFVHEWAHTLGAIHTRGVDCLMNPTYSASRESFCPLNFAVVRTGLDMPDRGDDAVAWHRALLELLDRPDEQDSTARQDMIAHLRQRLGPDAPPVEESATAIAAEDVQVVPDPETRACRLLGYQRLVLPAGVAMEHAEQELRQAAAEKGGDTVGVVRDQKGGKTVIHANIVRCGP